MTSKCDKLLKSVARNHDNFFFQKISDRFTSGLPDYYLLFNGQCVWIELKKTKAKPRNIQKYVMNKLRKAGANVAYFDDFLELERFIRSLVSQHLID